MFSFMIFCLVWFLHTVLIRCSENATAVIRVSVPEAHHVRLPCSGSDSSSDVVWTHQDRRVPVTRQGRYETNEDPQRYLLLSDGSLRLLRLHEPDGGEYHCNQRLVAELQVLTGHDFSVSAGWTLLLPCSSASKPRQKWFHRRDGGGRRELVLTRFRNGTWKPERSRLGYENEALQIQDLQPQDAGQYQCNGNPPARVTVLTEQPEPTRIPKTTRTTATPAVMETDVAETEKKKKKEKRPQNALLMVAVVGFGLMTLLMAAVCVLLTGMKCRRRRRNLRRAEGHEDTELQPWKTTHRLTESEACERPSAPEETIHYASLGRNNWRERPVRTPPDQNHNVIYSSVITRPAAE